jgi:hypothetical protein
MSVMSDLLSEIEAFRAATAKHSPRGKPIGEKYFGKLAAGNVRLIERLRDGKTVTMRTAERVRAFIKERTQ